MLKKITSSIIVVAMTTVGAVGTSGSATAQEINRAQFTTDGKAVIPENWRSWIYVGTPVTPNGLNKGKAPFPEFHNVYMEPSAFAEYAKTGAFPEGTQIVKELVLVKKSENGNEPDGSATEVCGRGYFPGEFHGLELTVKDTKRFAQEPGGWAYFSFGHKAPPYEKTAAALPTESCNACHEGAAAQDFVFTQFYPVLRAAKR